MEDWELARQDAALKADRPAGHPPAALTETLSTVPWQHGLPSVLSAPDR